MMFSSRFKVEELSFKRFFLAITRRLMSIPNKVYWEYSRQASKNRSRLKQFNNIHKGECCYLIANGPSLKDMDLSFLKGKITFGMNRIYLLSEQIDINPTYYVSINKTLIQQFYTEISSLDMPKFINFETRELFSDDKKVLYLYKSIFGSEFGLDISSSINPAATVTYAALQIIYYMGFSKVIIIGLDHNFSFQGGINETQTRKETADSNHFHPNYFPKGSKWETPDLVSSEYYYSVAKEIYERDGRKIIDCTVNGKCDVFDKGNFEAEVGISI